MLILVGAIFVAVASLLYLGTGANETAAIMQAARDGAENAIADIDVEYGCEIVIEEVGFDAGAITISIAVRSPPSGIRWENFRDNIIRPSIRDGALKHIYNAVVGFIPKDADNVRTRYYTYSVEVDARRVAK
jgi:hypothetical protein